MKRSSQPGEGGHAGHMAASFTDLMASLMVIFVLLFVATVHNASAKRQKVQSELLERLRTQLGTSGLDSGSIRQDDKDPYAIVIVMPDSLLFELGSSEVEEGGRKYLIGMMPVLAGILCAPEMAGHIDNVIVEGHTDTTYTARRNPSPDAGQAFNLQLSQQRSMEVVKTSLVALRDHPARSCFRGMLSASGRGQEEPLSGVPKDDARQRRVIFKIRVRSDLADELTGTMIAEANSPTRDTAALPAAISLPTHGRDAEVQEIRQLYDAIEAQVAADAFHGQAADRSCESARHARLYRDGEGTVRKYLLTAQSEHVLTEAHYYYDHAGVLRFTFRWFVADNNTREETRIYYDGNGREVHRDERRLSGPGYPGGIHDDVPQPLAHFQACA